MDLTPELRSIMVAMLELPWGATVAQIGQAIGRSITVGTLRPLISRELVLEVERRTPPVQGFTLSPRGKAMARKNAVADAASARADDRESNAQSPTDDLVTVPEAARIMGIDRDNVYRGIKKGRIPAVYLEGRKYDLIRVPRSAIERRRWAPGSADVLACLFDATRPLAITAAARLVYVSLFVNFGQKVRGPLVASQLARSTGLKDAEVMAAVDELERKGFITREQRPAGPAHGELNPPWAPATQAGRKGAT